jgi:hypothetical protein
MPILALVVVLKNGGFAPALKKKSAMQSQRAPQQIGGFRNPLLPYFFGLDSGGTRPLAR